MKSIVIKERKILGVEGIDECNFFESFFSFHNINGVQIINLEGKSKFNSKIRDLTNIPGFENVIQIGLVRDSDNSNPQDIFVSINNDLKKLNLSRPKQLSQFSEGVPSIGIFIMPNNSDYGMLEDLCLKSISTHAVSCIDEFFDCCSVKPKECSKAKIQCYLSTRDPLVKSLGLGAQNNHLDYKNPTFDKIKKFIINFK